MTVVLTALLGVLSGPFLHTLAVQAGADRPFQPLTSACPRCQHIAWTPRCGCGRTRWRELGTALLAAVGMGSVAYAVGPTPVLPAHLLMVAVTTVLVVTDFDHFRIANRILYPGTALCLTLLAAGAVADGRVNDLLRGVVGAIAYLLLFLLVYLAARGQGFGFGDVKLAFVLGLFLAFHSWQVASRGLFITALLGGVPAMALLLMGRSRTSLLPYGPPLILGTWAAIAFM
ncbi:MAG: prepilin peptidase [Acidimicrobiia bacterium]|nr:prepilin peptidase [Acidimicrobiia bacterium]